MAAVGGGGEGAPQGGRPSGRWNKGTGGGGGGKESGHRGKLPPLPHYGFLPLILFLIYWVIY